MTQMGGDHAGNIGVDDPGFLGHDILVTAGDRDGDTLCEVFSASSASQLPG